jgi:hypothetical protein
MLQSAEVGFSKKIHIKIRLYTNARHNNSHHGKKLASAVADTKHPEKVGEPLWLSGKVVKDEKINEIESTRVCSPPRANSF